VPPYSGQDELAETNFLAGMKIFLRYF